MLKFFGGKMKVQKVSKQNFGVTILSEKAENTLRKEKETIGHFWGVFSPQYDYLYQMQQENEDLHANGILDLRENKKSFSLLLLRQNDTKPIIKTFKGKRLSTKLIYDFLKSIKSNMPK